MKRWIALVCALAALAAFSACDVKGPAQPPEAVVTGPAAAGPSVEEPAPQNADTEELPCEAAVPEELPETPSEEPSEGSSEKPELKNAAAHLQETRYGELPEMKENYELAAEMGNRYGIYFHIADLVPQRIIENGSVPQNDPGLVGKALHKIDAILSVYPDGYFDQLVFGDYTGFDVYLVGFCPVGMGYVTSDFKDGLPFLMLVLDTETEDLINVLNYTLPHELTHLTDWRLQYVADSEAGHLFSEEAWMAVNPEGFEYAFEDQERESQMYDLYFPWFDYSYGCYSPLEDRATLFGHLMNDYFEESINPRTPEAYEKLGFYLQCLRDGFDTADWPEVTVWEAQHALSMPFN